MRYIAAFLLVVLAVACGSSPVAPDPLVLNIDGPTEITATKVGTDPPFLYLCDFQLVANLWGGSNGSQIEWTGAYIDVYVPSGSLWYTIEWDQDDLVDFWGSSILRTNNPQTSAVYGYFSPNEWRMGFRFRYTISDTGEARTYNYTLGCAE